MVMFLVHNKVLKEVSKLGDLTKLNVYEQESVRARNFRLKI